MFKSFLLSFLLTFSFLGASVSAQEISAKRVSSPTEIQNIKINEGIPKTNNTEAKPDIKTNIEVASKKGETPVLDFFHGAECPHCQREKKWHPILKSMFPNLQINEYEVWHEPKNQELLQKRLDALGKVSNGVPTNIIGEEVITGFDDKAIIKAITKVYGIEPLQVDEAKILEESESAGKKKKLIIFGIIALILVGGGIILSKKS